MNGWWAKHHPDILRGYEEALALGDCYLVINADLSVTVVPPHVVDPLLDGRGEVVGWRITESYPTPDPSPTSGRGEYTPLSSSGSGYGGTVTVIDEYTAAGRVRRVLRGGVTIRTEKYANLIGRVPVIHVANRYGADEFYGRPEGDALIPVLQRYGDVIEAAVKGNVRQGRPTPVIEKLGTAEQVRKFWEKFGRRETQTLPDGSTETVDVIDFDPDQLLTLGGEAQFKYAAPGSFSKDAETLLSVLFYLIVQHSEIPEAVWGASIPSSRASAETQMEPFVKWIEKKRGLAGELAAGDGAGGAGVSQRDRLADRPGGGAEHPVASADRGGRSAAAGHDHVGARRGGDRGRGSAAGIRDLTSPPAPLHRERGETQVTNGARTDRVEKA